MNLDDRALAAARGRARHQGTSSGQALSELALLEYEADLDTTRAVDGATDES